MSKFASAGAEIAMSPKCLPLCLVFWQLMGTTSSAQTSPPRQEPEPATATGMPVIRTTTRLLQVSVVVHDRQGEPVSDLTKDDFILFDKGQRQEIRYFSRESNGPAPDYPRAVVEGVISNRFVTVKVDGKTRVEPLPNSLTAILLDGLNTRFADQYQAKQALIRFLKQLHRGDQVAIYTLTDGLRVLHDFTSDISQLLAALDRHRNRDSMAMAASTYENANSGIDYLDALTEQANAKVATFSRPRRAEITLLALRSIANHLAGLPGRKNLIWLSGGFPVAVGAINGIGMAEDSRSLSDERQRTWRVLNDVGMAIYPVDARGLTGMAEWSPNLSAATASKAVIGRSPMDARAQSDIAASHLAMTSLADDTGGRACLNSNDIAGCIRGAMDDTRVTYVLYYTPSHDTWDSKFREIKIKLIRPGLEARYRRGYYAMPDLPTDQKTRETSLGSAAMSPLVSTGLTMVARFLVKPTEAAPHGVLSVVVDGHDIAFRQNEQGQQDATVDLRVLFFGDPPMLLKETERTGRLVLKPEEYERIMKDGVLFTVHVDAPAKSQRMRLVVRDAASGRVGSLDVPIR